mgnify:CR=1 FL=1
MCIRDRAGEGTSSRNSGVIHAGIYYPENSFKSRFCVEGNKMLYEYADEKNIGRLDLKNIKAQDRINKRLESSRNRLDKKILKRTGDASLTYRNRSAKQAANEERFSNIAKQLPKPIDLSKLNWERMKFLSESAKEIWAFNKREFDWITSNVVLFEPLLYSATIPSLAISAAFSWASVEVKTLSADW